jgi:hypothetical protein
LIMQDSEHIASMIRRAIARAIDTGFVDIGPSTLCLGYPVDGSRETIQREELFVSQKGHEKIAPWMQRRGNGVGVLPTATNSQGRRSPNTSPQGAQVVSGSRAAEKTGPVATPAAPAEEPSATNLAHGDAPKEKYVFRQQRGGTWEIRFPGAEPLTLPDMHGLRYIAFLLARQQEDIDVNDVYRNAIVRGKARMKEKEAEDEGLSITASSRQHLKLKRASVDPAVTDEATTQLRDRAVELSQKIERLRVTGLPKDLEQAESELKEVTGSLRKAFGKKRMRRGIGEPTKRLNVTKAISRAHERIRECHIELWRHLEACIHTGNSCSYKPPNEIDWLFVTPNITL